MPASRSEIGRFGEQGELFAKQFNLAPLVHWMLSVAPINLNMRWVGENVTVDENKFQSLNLW